MMINELPKNTATIATTYFENVDDQSQFRKEMDYNMKLLSGLDPATTNQEIYELNRQQDDKEIYSGTEQAILDTNDPEAIGFMANRMETLGAARRSNPDLALQDFYTGVEEANKVATDDVYRINYTNSKEDPHIYDTKYTIGMQKIYEAMENMQPNYARLAFRYVGQPALSIGATLLGGAVGGALTKTPAGAVKGAATGAAMSDALIAGWDSLALGGTIYNTQERFVNAWHELLADKSLTQEQFAQGVDDLVSDILTLDPAYQEEIFSAITQGPNPFADGGLTFTTFGLKTFAQPLGALARMAKKPIGYFGKSSSLKKMQMNQDLVNKIEKSMSNKVDEAVVDEAIATKVATTAPADASPNTIETVKGIEKNKITDEKLLKNNTNDKSYFDFKVSQEDIASHNANTSFENRSQAAEEAFNKRQAINARRERAGQRGEIRFEKPEQSYFIDHGKGVDNLPMTYEEALREMNRLQGRKFPVLYRERSIWGDKLEDVSDYVAVTTASRTPWESLHVEYRPGTGERSQSYGGGMYATFVDSDWEAARRTYLPNAQEVSDKAVLNTHYIPNPEKHPEMYLYYDNENPGLKPFAINIMNVKSDKYFKIAEKQQEIIRSAVKDIEKGLQERIQKAIKEGNTDLVNTLQFDHQFLLDHYDGDFNIFTWSEYLRENVYGLDKPSQDFRAWEKEYWKNKGVKGLIHEGDGSTSTNIVIFDESITKPVTKVETKTEQIGYDNAHMIVSTGDGVGYYVRELHGVDGAKPMIIKNGKVVDFGDYKPYNSKK